MSWLVLTVWLFLIHRDLFLDFIYVVFWKKNTLTGLNVTSYVNINLADKRRRYGQLLMINHNNTSKSFPLLISHIIVSNHQSNLYCFRHAICCNLTKAFTYSKTGQDKFAEISTKIVEHSIIFSWTPITQVI